MIRPNLLALGACAVAAAMVTSAPGTASAYVRYRTSTDQPYSWRVKGLSIAGYSHGLPSMTVDQITTAMTAAVGAWSKEDSGNALCSFLDLALTMMPVDTIPPDAVHDNVNTMAIRDGSWTSICSTTPDGLRDCHLPGELALTTVWSKTCGEIVEADVEVNADQSASGSDFMWADLDVAGAAGQREHDLQNALTHEMGHFIGLDHTCVLNGAYPLDKNHQPIIPTDDQGNPVLDCSDPAVTTEEQDATMYPSANPGDLDKRTLSGDDRAGLCAIYPIGTNPVSCGHASTGCSIAADAGSADETGAGPRGGRSAIGRWLVLGLAGAAGMFAVVRRRRRRLPRR